MMLKRKLIFIACLLFAGIITAQNSLQWLRFGDEMFRNENYVDASVYYKNFVDNKPVEKTASIVPYDVHTFYPPVKNTKDTGTNKTSANSAIADSVSSNPKEIVDSYVIHQLGECFRLLHDYDQAELWYGKSAALKRAYTPLDIYWYGQMQMRNMKYHEAVVSFEKFMQLFSNDQSKYYKKAERDIMACDVALADTASAKGVAVAQLDSAVNGKITSFGVSTFLDSSSILFSSYKKNTSENTDQVSSIDIYTSSQTGQSWSFAGNIGEPVNSTDNEGTPSVYSTDTKTDMYFTRWSDEKKEYAIYLSRFMFGRWLSPLKLNSNVNKGKAIQPSISDDGKTLFFVSDRSGGEGKLDIWYCSIDESGSAGPAKNLGSRINTEDDDVSPFYHVSTSALYFSTEGRVGLGGLDVFKSEGHDTVWSTPLNLGKPINSSKDDAYFTLNENETAGYFSSDRKKCAACQTGYCYFIYAVTNTPIRITISGKVLDKNTNQIIPNALITINDPFNPGKPAFVITDDNGEYTFSGKDKDKVYLKTQKVNYFAKIDTVNIGNKEESKNIKWDILLEPVPTGDIVIPGIEYDYNKADLRETSKKILDDVLVRLLNMNSNMSIEIGSHTDARGGDDYNLKLSEARAKSCVEYLISRGIKAERLTSKGYGETKLLIVDATTEEQHQRNRRTAFRVLKIDRPKAGE